LREGERHRDKFGVRQFAEKRKSRMDFWSWRRKSRVFLGVSGSISSVLVVFSFLRTESVYAAINSRRRRKLFRG
jgi:hypothetical protein